MNAIIMAGGEGTRLKPVTGDTPKPMALLAGKPVLEHILNLLKRNGIKRACLALHYRPEVIRNHFGDGEEYGIRLSYQIERAALGTAGAVKACRGFYDNRDFLVISGDCACDFDLRALMEAHRRRKPAVTMALATQETPLQYGTVLTNATGRVLSFIEKPSWERVVTDFVNTGIYVISPEAMEFVPDDEKQQPFDFAKDLFPALMEAGLEIQGVPMEGYWCDIGTPRAYYQCNLDALDGKLKLDSAAPAPAPQPKPAAEAPRNTGMTVVEYRCRSRARLMRELSQRMVEAGAEFDVSDGLVLKDAAGQVRIAPSPEREAVIISADAADPARSAALANNFSELVRGLEL